MKLEKTKISAKTSSKLQKNFLLMPHIKLKNHLINVLVNNLKNIHDFKDTEQTKKVFQKNYDLMSHDEKIYLKSKLCLDKSQIDTFKKLFSPNIKTAIILEMRHFFRHCLNENNNFTKHSVSVRIKDELNHIINECQLINLASERNNPVSLALSELHEIFARNPKETNIQTLEKHGQFYMTKEQRKDFEITLSNDGILRQCGKPVAVNKKVYAVRYEAKNQVTKPVLCMASRNEKLPQHQRLGWSHSCFFAGASVAGGGEISTNDAGKVTHIDNNTGHYQVNPVLLAKTIILLKDFLANNLNIEFSSTFYTKGIRTFETDKNLHNISKKTALLWAENMINFQKKAQPLIYSLNNPKCNLSMKRKKEIFSKLKNKLYQDSFKKVTNAQIDEKEKIILLQAIEKSVVCWEKEFDLGQHSTRNIDPDYYPVLWERN